MTQTRKKWLISPNTKRKYAICIRCWFYKGELCEKYVAYFLFKARYRLEKDIEIQAKFLKKKELENKKTYECNANAKSLGMCKERV